MAFFLFLPLSEAKNCVFLLSPADNSCFVLQIARPKHLGRKNAAAVEVVAAVAFKAGDANTTWAIRGKSAKREGKTLAIDVPRKEDLGRLKMGPTQLQKISNNSRCLKQ